MIVHPNKLIIHRSHCQSLSGRWGSLILSAVYWALLTYWLKGLVILLGWGTALELADLVVSDMPVEAILENIVQTCLLPVLGAIMLLWGWALYNWLRFHGALDRRRTMRPRTLSLKTISRACCLPASTLEEMRGCRTVVCHFDRKGNIRGVECGMPGQEAHLSCGGEHSHSAA